MGLTINYLNGQTPLSEDEREGLLIASITTREELDEAEQRNIEEAIRWTIERRKNFQQKKYCLKISSKNCTVECSEKFGHGQENFGRQIKI
jgi:hypothetical protein